MASITQTTKSEIVLVTALAAEAKPLVTTFNLKRQQQHTAFTVFKDPEQSLYLIVSGTGAFNAAAATAYMSHLLKQPKAACFCNIGIAGGLQPIGSLWQCHKIIDIATSHHYYPTVNHHQIASTNLHTTATVQDQYPANSLVDMEGSGFFHAAQHFTSTEQISLLKIISDNSDASRKNINANTIFDLITQNKLQITQHIQSLMSMSSEENHRRQLPQYYHEVIEAIHFTVSQQHQLKTLLKRWQQSFAAQSPLQVFITRDARQFLKSLRKRLHNADYHWS